MSGKPDVSIIVVSFNTRKLTLECLRSVYRESADLSHELIVVDNASMDGSPEAIASEFPQLQLFALQENLGFARANNFAAQQAQADYLLLLNPDTVVLDNAIRNLLAFARQHPSAGIYGGRTLMSDGRLNPTSCWGRPTLWSTICNGIGLATVFSGNSLFDPETMGKWRRDTVRNVDIVSGCFLLIEKRLWDRLGGFDESFFMYAEDFDLCLRARTMGYRPLLTPRATIIHHGNASEPSRVDQTIRQFRAKAQLFRKHWGHRSAWWAVRMLDLWALRRSLAASVLRFARPRKAELYRSWQQAWQRRKEWRWAEAD